MLEPIPPEVCAGNVTGSALNKGAVDGFERTATVWALGN